MGSTQIPASTPWLELATSTPTTGSTVSFTSLSEYNDYRVEWFALTTTAGGGATNFAIRFNGDSGTNYAYALRFGTNSLADSAIQISGPCAQTQLDINGANGASKKIFGFTGITLSLIHI